MQSLVFEIILAHFLRRHPLNVLLQLIRNLLELLYLITQQKNLACKKYLIQLTFSLPVGHWLQEFYFSIQTYCFVFPLRPILLHYPHHSVPFNYELNSLLNLSLAKMQLLSSFLDFLHLLSCYRIYL